nr:solute carrier family 23 member 2-like [Procambarus clarkii]
MTGSRRPDVTEEEGLPSELVYTLEDNPPWYLCVFLGAQHFFTMVSTTIPIPFVLASLVCLEPSDPVRSHLVSTIVFVSGLITLLQSTVGVRWVVIKSDGWWSSQVGCSQVGDDRGRLPIVQGGNFAYLIPTMALLSANFGSCEAQWAANITAQEQQEAWQSRMRVIQGNIAVSSLFQILLGFTADINTLPK